MRCHLAEGRISARTIRNPSAHVIRLCPATAGVFIFPTVSPVPDHNINGILQSVASSDWLPPLRSAPLKRVRVFARVSARCLLSLTSVPLPDALP